MSDHWWVDFFDLKIAGLILAETRPNEISFLLRHLRLGPGNTVLDQCCGWGRVSGPLARSGMTVVGIDASAPLVEAARQSWEGLDVEFLEGDAAEHHQEPPCDAGLNLYSSFGYTQDHTHNQSVLNRLVEGVKKGGRLVLDTINPGRVYAHFQPVLTQRTPCGTRITRSSVLEKERKSLRQVWEFRESDGTSFSKQGTTWLYDRDELADMLIEAGCKPKQCFADLHSQPYTPQGERLIWLAER